MSPQHVPIEIVRVPAWESFAWLKHGFSVRPGGVSTVYSPHEPDTGDLNLGFTRHDAPDSVRQNRRRFAEAVSGHAGLPVVAVRQVHGKEIVSIPTGKTGFADAEGRALVEADGMITSTPGLLLGIQVADCVPILVADTRRRIVAALHAGWRGTVAGIVQAGVAEMSSRSGAHPEDLIAAVGPSVGACCYTVGQEVRAAFEAAYPYAPELFANRPTGLHLDLAEANRRQLLTCGLSPHAITLVGECTACTRLPGGQRKYFSHRDEQGFTGRAMGMIGIVHV